MPSSVPLSISVICLPTEHLPVSSTFGYRHQLLSNTYY